MRGLTAMHPVLLILLTCLVELPANSRHVLNIDLCVWSCECGIAFAALVVEIGSLTWTHQIEDCLQDGELTR
jgi:hypothetical protein